MLNIPHIQTAAMIPVGTDGSPMILWNEQTLCRALAVSRTILWQRIATGAMPAPEKMPDDRGQRGKSNRWRVQTVLDWLAAGMPHFKTWKEQLTAGGAK